MDKQEVLELYTQVKLDFVKNQFKSSTLSQIDLIGADPIENIYYIKKYEISSNKFIGLGLNKYKLKKCRFLKRKLEEFNPDKSEARTIDLGED
ncbi:hypothetical protein IQ235_11745 [Oscillatoriales cyanobacterium LEGE 11467]|uniref:Uncharacterized protein n=1 Tax=Zarconia navalis LEGE 11467 TaxID=1828826 RepID=A0A928Z996_9CYAN|nr:hypothetical protein [Zarconia navalis]MBE9041454.1 hypothetical protein [Zarconia navalis LEGE 11467]